MAAPTRAPGRHVCDVALACTSAGGARWFHSGGIYSALSPTTPELIIEGMKAAHANGAVTSFDLNYRAKLWKHKGGVAKCQEVMNEICKHVDILLGNEEGEQMDDFIPCRSDYIHTFVLNPAHHLITRVPLTPPHIIDRSNTPTRKTSR